MTSDAESYLKKLEEIQNGTTAQDTIFKQTPDEDKFTINADTREISVPSSFSNIGVIYDHNAETIFFKIPRYFDNIDLNDHTCIIQYINAGKEEDIYTVTQKDLSTNGEIIFGWKITNSVTKYAGSVSFAVRFYSITNGVFDYNFNTKVAQFNVLSGLNITANDIVVNPDLLSQWIEKINALDKIQLPMRTSELINDSNFLSQENDPTVPEWAKQPTKPTYTSQEVGAVDKSGGAISETIVDTLETIDTKFPIPSAGETIKRFLGKVIAFLTNIKPLESNVSYYVAITGSDTNAGTSTSPFKTIKRALNAIPRDLGGQTATINIDDGTYSENVNVSGYSNGVLEVKSQSSPEVLNTVCKVTNITINDCQARVNILGLYFTMTNNNAFNATNNAMIYVRACQAVESAPASYGFNFLYSRARVWNCRSINHKVCVRSYMSNVSSENWSADSLAVEYGISVDIGGQIYKVGNQPPGAIGPEYTSNGGVITSKYGAKIGTIQGGMTLCVSPAGSDMTGNGTSASPYQTIQYTIDNIPKNLSGYTVYIMIADGTYDESLDIRGFYGGVIEIKSQTSPGALNTVCKVKRVVIDRCPAKIHLFGLYFTQVDDIAVNVSDCDMVYINYCQAIESAVSSVAFNFLYSKARVTYCRSIDHINCIKSYLSEVSSQNWTDSTAVEYGLLVDVGGNISKIGNQPTGTKGAEFAQNGGVIINKYGGQVGSLLYGVSCYVSPTGSDTTGNGASSNPYKTIKYALSTIPRDLGGYTVTIYLADGIYDEEVRLAGYHSGIIDIKSSSNPEVLNTVCCVRRIYANDCSARLRFYGLYLTQKDDDAFFAANCSFILLVSCQAVEDTAPLATGFNFTYSTARLFGCKCMYHKLSCRSYLSDVSSEEWISSFSTDYGLSAERGGKIIKSGNQPSGDIRNERTLNGGMIVEANGTQITNITYSGLSCAWGTVQGGYIRHGSVNAAMITVQIRVPVTVALTANQQYIISGFPKSSVDFGIACNIPQKVTNCFFSSAPGEIRFTPTVTFAINDVIAFNCTYLTTT